MVNRLFVFAEKQLLEDMLRRAMVDGKNDLSRNDPVI